MEPLPPSQPPFLALQIMIFIICCFSFWTNKVLMKLLLAIDPCGVRLNGVQKRSYMRSQNLTYELTT